MSTSKLETSVTADMHNALWEIKDDTIHALLQSAHVEERIKQDIENDLQKGYKRIAWEKTLLLHEIEESIDSSKHGTVVSHSDVTVQATSKGVLRHRLLAIGKSTADVSSQTAVDYMKDLLVPVIRYVLVGFNIALIHIPFIGTLLAFIPMEEVTVPIMGTMASIGLYMGIAHVVKLHDEKEKEKE